MVFFHNPDEENGYLSNWYLSSFTVSHQQYSSAEQYMMHQKALAFGDTAAAEAVLNTQDVGEIKAIGRAVSNYNETVWNGLRQVLMYKGLLAKFQQNYSLRAQLLDTGDELLVECAVKDTIWAVGLSMTDERRFDMGKWRGKNLLGFVLMEVRSTLNDCSYKPNTEDDAIFFTCSLIEYIGRITKNKRVDVVTALGPKRLEHIYELADVYHSDNIDRVSQDFIEEASISTGKFDNVVDCDYAVPDFWDIGRVFARLVAHIMLAEKVAVVPAIVRAYGSTVSDLILDFNGLFFTENPDNIYITYSTGLVE